jgi:hypothetical protein
MLTAIYLATAVAGSGMALLRARGEAGLWEHATSLRRWREELILQLRWVVGTCLGVELAARLLDASFIDLVSLIVLSLRVVGMALVSSRLLRSRVAQLISLFALAWVVPTMLVARTGAVFGGDALSDPPEVGIAGLCSTAGWLLASWLLAAGPRVRSREACASRVSQVA